MNASIANGLSQMQIDINDVSVVSPRDAYVRLCQGRDLELGFVWQRSIVLTAFMLGCFTAYGVVVKGLLQHGLYMGSNFINAVAFLISQMGMTMSIVWTMMAKGSKFTYELYESAIESFRERNTRSIDVGTLSLMQRTLRACVSDSSRKDSNRNIFSSSGGEFSSSRLNIAIGHLFIVVWLVISIFHIIIAMIRRSDSAWLLSCVKLLKTVMRSPSCMMIIVVLVFMSTWAAGCFVYNSKTSPETR